MALWNLFKITVASFFPYNLSVDKEETQNPLVLMCFHRVNDSLKYQKEFQNYPAKEKNGKLCAK